MRKGLDKHEVESLANTTRRFAACVVLLHRRCQEWHRLRPTDPRKQAVSRDRWYKAVMPFVKTYDRTGGDMNVDELHDVIPITERYGRHPQEGVVKWEHPTQEDIKLLAIQQLRMV